jgi:hypothetical protein
VLTQAKACGYKISDPNLLMDGKPLEGMKTHGDPFFVILNEVKDLNLLRIRDSSLRSE